MQKHPQSFANLYKYVGRDSVMKSIRIQTDNQLQYRLYCTMLPKCRGLRSCSSWFSWSFLRSSNNSCPRNRIERTLANAVSLCLAYPCSRSDRQSKSDCATCIKLIHPLIMLPRYSISPLSFGHFSDFSTAYSSLTQKRHATKSSSLILILHPPLSRSQIIP